MEQFPLEELISRVGSRFAVVVAAAKRAKQIKDGSPPLVATVSRNPLTIALAEIGAGKVLIMDAGEIEDEGAIITSDQYYAGREHSVEEPIIFRREVRAAASIDDDVDDDLDDDDDDTDEEETEEDE